MFITAVLMATVAAFAATTAFAQEGFPKVERPRDEKISVLFINPVLNYIEPALARELLEAGFFVDSTAGWNTVTLEKLRRFNVVVIENWKTHGQGWNEKYGEILDEYLKLGGGLIFTMAQEEGAALEPKAWLVKHGIKPVHQTIFDEERAQLPPNPKYFYNHKFTLTRNIKPHPVTEGVSSLWYPQLGVGDYGLPAAMAMALDDNWTTLVASEKTSKISSAAVKILDPDNFLPERDGKVGEWPMIASRRIGNGRAVAIGLAPNYYLTAPHFHLWGEVGYRNGIGGVPSDFHILFKNALRWAAQPSFNKGDIGLMTGLFPPQRQSDTPAVDWSVKKFSAPGPWLRGVAGVQSSLSSGQGTVAEWARAAKAEGLSFLVFLEDMSLMNEVKWEQLKQECAAASDAKFRCYPGMDYRMRVDGNEKPNHRFVVDGYATRLFPPQRFLNEKNEIWVRAGNEQAPYFMDLGQNNHPDTRGENVGFSHHEQNATPFWDYKLHGIFSVFTADGEKRIDDAVQPWLEAIAANVNPVPFAIDYLRDPAQLKGYLEKGRPHLVVNGAYDERYPQMEANMGQVDLHVGTRGERPNAGMASYRGWFGPTVTEGPAASLRFRGGYKYERVEYPRYFIERYVANAPEDWFMASNARLPVRLDVSSDVPLEEIIIYNGTQVFRRFDGEGKKEFHTEFWVPQAQNLHLTAYVKDSKGRRAITPEIWMEQQQNLYDYCGDRINVCSTPGFTPGHGNAWHEGVVDMSGSSNHAFPKALPGTGTESRRYDLDLVSPDVSLERATSDGYFATLLPGMSLPWHNWTSPTTRLDLTHGSLRKLWYQAHDKQYLHPGEASVHWDGYLYLPTGNLERFSKYVSQSQWAQTKKELTPLQNSRFVPGASQVLWQGQIPEDGAIAYEAYRPGTSGAVASGKLRRNGEWLQASGPLADGGVIVLRHGKGFTARVRGTNLGYAFYVFDGGKVEFRVAPIAAAPVPAQTRFDWSYDLVEQVLENPVARDARWLQVLRGELVDHFIGAVIKAQGGTAQVKIAKQPLKVNSTPLQIRGVNSNWMSGLLEKTTGNYRPIGSEKDIAYAQVPASAENIELVMGNVLVADSADLKINAVQNTDRDGKWTGGWLVDVHNPTGAAISATLRPGSGFEGLFKGAPRPVKLAPGASVQVDW